MPLRSKILIGIVVTASLAIAVALAVLGPRMVPIRRGTSHGFWDAAAYVQLSDISSDWGGDAHVMDEFWAAYEVNHMHGSNVYCVPLSEVTKDFDVVLGKLEEFHQAGKDRRDHVKGYLAWKELTADRRTVKALVELIKQERNIRIAKEQVDVVAYRGAEEYRFQQRWRQADWYWADFVFEWLYLSGLLLFALWPGIRGHSAIRWALHVASLPFLFFLPVYLGYATMALTSGGPGGGVLYPYLLFICRGGSCNGMDEFLLRYTPPILEPLTAPIGSPMALTGFGLMGPTTAIVRGLWYGGTLIVACRIYQYFLRRRQRFADLPKLDITHE